MQWYSLIPRRDDRCQFCGGVLLCPREAVLVPDGLETAAWWHTRCRDLVMPLLPGEPYGDADGLPAEESTA